MNYLSVCSGIEAATVAWHPLGWRAVAYSEIEAFPRAVLAHHYPDVPLHGDFTTIGGDEYGAIDLLVGGTPCQDFSVAGLRAGIAGDRGNLTLEFLRLADRLAPRWIVWENVPGVLSSDGGRALGAFLGGLAEFGYGWAYRVLDAAYFGLAQRRARVFVVGYLGDWRRAAAVLFERESLQGNPPPRREAGQRVANSLVDRPDRGFPGEITVSTGKVSHCLNAGGMGRQDYETETLIAHSLRAEGCAVRRLTPRECCRLQGFPDDYLDITYCGKPAADGPKYKALGNSMAVPCMRWIGERIAMVQQTTEALRLAP